MQRKTGGVVSLLAVMIAKYTNKKEIIKARTVFSTQICVVSIQRVNSVNHSVRNAVVHAVVGVSSIFIHRILQSFHKFTLVFSQTSYKPQIMSESSSRFIALD